MSQHQPKPRVHLTRFHGVFGIDIHTCAACGGTVRIIACIEDPNVIEKILARLDQKTTESP